jgi:hypothetical protein
MGLLWNRKASVIFGVKGETGVKVSALRISFDIEKTRESTANTAKITIYNLNPNNRDLLKNKENLTIILEVGYADDFDQLWVGDIARSSTRRQGSDFITTIESEDGGQALREAKIDKSYAPGVSAKTIVGDLIQSFKDAGQTVGGTVTKVKDEIAQNGFTASGISKIVLEQLLAKQGLEFSIQDNEIQILEQLAATEDEAVVLTPETGLIGSPFAREKGIEFRALIQSTKLRPGRPVRIQSLDFDGFFKINKARYQGDTHDKAWYVICEAEEV